jgi:hypothetical protein
MRVFRSLAAAAVALLVFSLPSSLSAQVRVLQPVGHDVSKPLRDMPVIPAAFENFNLHEVKPAPSAPNGGPDGALQTQPGTNAVTINNLAGFDGPGLSTGLSIAGEPPDPNASVGATQVVMWVNTSFAVYDKSTHAKTFPASGFAAGNSIWQGFSGGRCATDNSGDPIVLYDKQAQRWIFTQFAVSTTPYFQCVAVSTTSDATGPYNRYAFSFSTNFPDYPKVGIWTDAYYFTFNLFAHGSRFAGADRCAFDKKTAIAGGNATMICSATSTSFASILPADLDGNSGASGTTAAPPAGTAEYMMSFGTNLLNIWRITPNFTAGTLNITGPTTVSVASFSKACNGGACIPQPGTTQQLDSLGDRLMYRLSYRNFGTFASLLVSHSVTAGSSVGVRWYELRDTGSGPTVFQQGTFAPDANFRWMPSIAQDKQGNIAVGYSVSSSSVQPAIRFASRAPSDPAGTLSSETNLQTGAGVQSGHNRWGDYTSMSVDPSDDCTFYYANEWLNTSGDFIWSTHISSFKLGTCQ